MDTLVKIVIGFLVVVVLLGVLRLICQGVANYLEEKSLRKQYEEEMAEKVLRDGGVRKWLEKEEALEKIRLIK